MYALFYYILKSTSHLKNFQLFGKLLANSFLLTPLGLTIWFFFTLAQKSPLGKIFLNNSNINSQASMGINRQACLTTGVDYVASYLCNPQIKPMASPFELQWPKGRGRFLMALMEP